MAAPKMEDAGKITGANLINGMKKRNAQMKFLMSAMTEPDLSPIQSFDSIAKSFDMDNEEDGEVVNTQGITWRLLNSQGFGNGRHDTDNEPTYMSVAMFMNSIQSYLPESLRAKRKGYQLWKKGSFNPTNTFSEETKELLDQMVDWLMMMKNKIEDKISSNYYFAGRPHQLEVLKRRFKDHWSERIENDVDASVAQDTEVRVVLEDFEDGDKV